MKAEKLLIDTPEKIQFTYTISEIGTRIAAYFIDVLIEGVFFTIVLILGGFTLTWWKDFGEDRALYYMAVIYIMLFLLQWGYFILFETLMNGQTPGKKICRIRVIRLSGERLDFSTLVIRNLLRAADSLPLPLFNFLGGLTAIIQKRNRRLGDLAAGTVVVSDSVFNLTEPDFHIDFLSDSEGVLQSPREKEKLTEKDLYIVRALLKDRQFMPEETARRTAEAMLKRVEKRFDLSELKEKDAFHILEEIYRIHNYENQK